EGFEKKGDNPSVTFTVKVTQSGVLYMYIPSTYPRDCKLYVNGTMRGKYFTNDTHCITELGSFEEGDEVTVQLNCEKDKLYIGYGIDYFYIFDEDAFVDAVNELKCTSLETTSFRDDRIEGVLTVTEGHERVMTTIPYDEGWVITANGQRVSYEKTLDALIAFDLPAGEYDIVLKYSPSCVKIGAAISAGGVLLFAGACVLAALRKKKKAAISASGETVEVPPEDADLIFEEADASVTPDTDGAAAEGPDEANTLPDADNIPPEEDNEEETT
ncbi:MAG: YfhO family protein, partial [Clostridia bacterium]|nr:YfhO family protein [Clostridia bacterium]